VHSIVVDAMREAGFDLAERHPQQLTDELAQWADILVTMGCGDECPFIPGKRYVDWELEDPAGKSLEEVRQLRDDIKGRVARLAAELG
jgi:arsenate reductase